jgi:hypothetical protein
MQQNWASERRNIPSRSNHLPMKTRRPRTMRWSGVADEAECIFSLLEHMQNRSNIKRGEKFQLRHGHGT